MTLPRRRFLLSLAAASAAMPGLARLADAADYPARPVRIFEGFGGGGEVDLLGILERLADVGGVRLEVGKIEAHDATGVLFGST